MRNAILGAIAGSIVTLLCVFAVEYFTPEPAPPSSSPGGQAAVRKMPAVRTSAEPARRPSKDTAGRPASGTTPARAPANTTEQLIEELLAAGGDDADAEENVEGEADVSGAIDSLAEFYTGRDRRTARALRDRVEELKKKGREVVPDLVNILKGSGSNASKVIAAGVLGAINAKLQDPEITALLSDEVVPMLKGIVGGEGDRGLQRQAVSALGDIATASAHKVLAELATGEGDGRTRMAASRTLARTGTVETAYSLMSSLTNPRDDAELLTMAGCIAEINRRVNDAGVTQQLSAVVPRIEEMVKSAGNDRRGSWTALSTLGAIGTSDANDFLVELMAGGEGVDERLQRSASWAIGSSGTPELATQLGETLQNETDAARCISLASVIARIAARNPDTSAVTVSESQALPALKILALSGETEDVQRRAVETIGRVGSASDIPSLKEIAQANESLQSAVDGAVRSIERRTEGGGGGRGGFGFRGRGGR